jgi:PAS domain-containing protein
VNSKPDQLVLLIDETLAHAAALHEEIKSRIRSLEDVEREAQLERARCRALFELLPEALVLTDAAGLIRQFNLAAVRQLNVLPTTLAGKPVYVFVALEQRYALRDGVTALPQGARFSHSVTLLPRRRPPERARVVVQALRAPIVDGIALSWLIEPLAPAP